MEGPEDGFLCSHSGVQVNLCGGNGTVSEKFLDIFDVYPLFQKKAGEGMTEHVGRDMPKHSRVIGIAKDHISNTLCGKLCPEFGNKNVWDIRIAAAANPEVLVEDVQYIVVAEEHRTELSSLSTDTQRMLSRIQIIEGQAAQLADAKATGKQDFQNRCVSKPEEFARPCADFSLPRQDLREMLAERGRHFIIDGTQKLMHFAQ